MYFCWFLFSRISQACDLSGIVEDGQKRGQSFISWTTLHDNVLKHSDHRTPQHYEHFVTIRFYKWNKIKHMLQFCFFFCKLLEQFVEEYFDQNPISQLGILVTRNKRAEKVTELGGKWTVSVILSRLIGKSVMSIAHVLFMYLTFSCIWHVTHYCTGNPRRHIIALQNLAGKPCQGELSLQNSLEMALQTLRLDLHCKLL